ncbi:MAG: hypothetical protein QF793_02685, partial [Candidatus Peribacteraceae bacterium]|nr:hypothetical protein [Candidatus Peribacteraceae bacterium]
MTTYTYQATDASGKTVDGTVEAHSLQAARDAVVNLGMEPLEIYEAHQKSSSKSDSPWVDPLQAIQADTAEEPSTAAYFPLLDTLRLYAGWLLAWYCIVYAIGAYQFMKELPFRLPYA